MFTLYRGTVLGWGRTEDRRCEMAFTPLLTTLPPAQRALWPELADTPGVFTLYGGTALALRVGHRASVDCDFFNASFDPAPLCVGGG